MIANRTIARAIESYTLPNLAFDPVINLFNGPLVHCEVLKEKIPVQQAIKFAEFEEDGERVFLPDEAKRVKGTPKIIYCHASWRAIKLLSENGYTIPENWKEMIELDLKAAMVNEIISAAKQRRLITEKARASVPVKRSSIGPMFIKRAI